MGSVIKKAGESFILKESTLTSQSFSITGFYQNGDEWLLVSPQNFSKFGRWECR